MKHPKLYGTYKERNERKRQFERLRKKHLKRLKTRRRPIHPTANP